ncbi:MAG TPA: asparagine synthase-related protein, partial [Chitinophagaceae bacterium]|nr:asparagine synthase-related protein [Chitinophagaceae bacterium]
GTAAGQRRFLFASEMKALWAAGMPRQANNTALLNYIALGQTSPVHEPFHTFYKNIFQLPPAHYLRLRLQLPGNTDTYEWKATRYWTINKNIQVSDSAETATEQFRQLLTTSVERRLRSDVPVGTSLSGGLDSSSILALVHRLLPPGAPINTFSAVFPGFERDESAYIKTVVDRFHPNSFEVRPTADGFARDLEQLLHYHETPIGSASIYAQYKVFELAAQQGVKVLLDGQGADELLAGYSKYAHWFLQGLVAGNQYRLAANEKKLLRQNGVAFNWGWKNYLAARLPGRVARQLQQREIIKLNGAPLIHPGFIDQYRDSNSIYKPVITGLNDILHYNSLENGLEELLRYADRNSMAHGREVRLPFLSHELAEYVFSLPPTFKIRQGWTKWLLRNAMDSTLPASIAWRKDKTGFEPPQQAWMAHAPVLGFIHEAKKKLVHEKILTAEALQTPIQPLEAYAADNFDWRYLVAAQLL